MKRSSATAVTTRRTHSTAASSRRSWTPEPDTQGVLRIDWAPLLEVCRDNRVAREERAGQAHAALADAICRVAEAERARSGVAVAGLTGGVFQNRRLLELAAAGLEQRGFRVLLPERIPCNDGGLSYGQVAEFLGAAAAAAPH